MPPGERCSIPHHLIDLVEPDEEYSAGEFSRDGRAVLAKLRSKGVPAVLAGGTGFYLQALLAGLFDGPKRDRKLRERLRRDAERNPPGHLWSLLAEVDPKASEAIHPNDEPKLIRAIEVCRHANRPMTDQWCASRTALPDYRILTLGLSPDRRALYARIEERARRMFGGGLTDEIRDLLGSGVPRSAWAFGALGYRQGLRFVDGRCTLDEAVESTVRATRRYAKRQLTWFRNRTPGVRWLQDFGTTQQAWEWARSEVDNWLATDEGTRNPDLPGPGTVPDHPGSTASCP